MDCETKIKTYIQRVIDGSSSSVTFVRRPDHIAGRLEVEVHKDYVRVDGGYGGTVYKMHPEEIVVWTDRIGDVMIGNKHRYVFANMTSREPQVFY